MNATRSRSSWIALVVALTAGIAAAWMVSRYAAALREQTGTPIAVLVARQSIKRGQLIDQTTISSVATTQPVPREYAPVDALTSVDSLVGSRASVAVPAGAYLTLGSFAPSGSGAGYRLRPDERAVTIHARVAPSGTDLTPGQRVDVLASGIGGAAVSQMILRSAEVLEVADSGGGDAAARPQVTLRVAVSQARPLVRADVFAKEVRLLLNP